MESKIKERLEQLFDEEKIEAAVFFEKGTLPTKNTPNIVYKKEDLENLIWNPLNWNNLAAYLPKLLGKKIGIVAKGCDTRSITLLIQEQKVNREDIYIIGVPCSGMVNIKAIEQDFGEEITGIEFENSKIKVKGIGSGKEYNKQDFLYESCRFCVYPNPVIYDEVVGEKVEGYKGNQYEEIEEFEKNSPKERREYMVKELSRCIRCYACRNSCPSCYCQECFVDSNQPKWLEKGQNIEDIFFYHIVRAYHMAGRCVDCGSCQNACPMDINILKLTRKLNKDVKNLYDYECGLDPDNPPALSTFEQDDYNEFIK